MEENLNNAPSAYKGEDEIDIREIILKLWARRKLILCATAAFTVLGLFAALFQKPVYDASCTFVPDKSGSSSGSSSLSSLAAIAGINLGDMSSGTMLSPLIYPQLLQNINFNKELMRVPLDWKKYSESVSVYELISNPEYRKFNLLSVVKKYTIGLPGVIIGAVRKDEKDSLTNGADAKVNSYSEDEYKAAKALSKMLSLSVDKKDGYLTLTATSNEALVSAELCQAALDLMQKYVSDFKLRQARESLGYIEARYEEAKSDYTAKQLALAQFVDSNQGVLTATAQTMRQQLTSDYEISMALFTEISKQKLQAEMKVKEDTPVLSAVKPVSVPMQKSNSRAKTLAIWIFLGFALSCCAVLVYPYLCGIIGIKETEITTKH